MENNSVKKNKESKKVVNKKTITEYYNKLCYDEKYSQNKLFICLKNIFYALNLKNIIKIYSSNYFIIV